MTSLIRCLCNSWWLLLFNLLISLLILQNQCVNTERNSYSGVMNGTIHVVVGGGGSHLSNFSQVTPSWSLYRDYDYGFVKLTAFNHSSLLFEYKKSSDGKVYDSFTISRDYRDVLACVPDSCGATSLASWVMLMRLFLPFSYGLRSLLVLWKTCGVNKNFKGFILSF